MAAKLPTQLPAAAAADLPPPAATAPKYELIQVSLHKICEIAFTWLGHAESYSQRIMRRRIDSPGELAESNLDGAISLLENAQYTNYCFNTEDRHYVYMQGKKIMAFTTVLPVHKELYVSHLCVNPRCIVEVVKGIGSSLVERVTTFAVKHGFTCIALDPKDGTEEFYEGLGFKEMFLNYQLRIKPHRRPHLLPKKEFTLQPEKPFFVTPVESIELASQLQRDDYEGFANAASELSEDPSGRMIFAMKNERGEYVFAYLLDVEENTEVRIVESYIPCKEMEEAATSALSKFVRTSKRRIVVKAPTPTHFAHPMTKRMKPKKKKAV